MSDVWYCDSCHTQSNKPKCEFCGVVNSTLELQPSSDGARSERSKNPVKPGQVHIMPAKTLDPRTSKAGKLPLAELHPDFLPILCGVHVVSVEKGYVPMNWLNPENKVTSTYLASAALRHIRLFLKGEDKNKEKKLDGSPCSIDPYHMACAAYNCLMACVQMQEGLIELDDRPLRGNKK